MEKTRLPEYSVERDELDCYKTSGFNLNQLQAAGAEIDTATAPVLATPEILVFVADPSIGDKYRYWTDAADQQICGCGKCTRHLWAPANDAETIVKPLGKGLFRITTPANLRPGVHALYNTATTRLYAFRIGAKGTARVSDNSQTGSLASGGESNPATLEQRRLTLASAIASKNLNAIRRLATDAEVVNAAGAEGSTPLMSAVESGNVAIVRSLLSAGANPRTVAPGHGDALGAGYTALTLAVTGDQVEMVKLLLEAGADPNSIGTYGGTVLADAMTAGQAEIVRLLTRAGARLNPTAAMLVAAAGGGFADEVRRLIAGGAKVNEGAGYKGSWTALMAAARGGHVVIVQSLLDAGADLEAVDDAAGRAVLGHAAAEGHAAVVSLLIHAGASLKGQASQNREPALHTAAANGRLDVVKMLLQAGADPAERYSDRTAEDLAREAKHTAVVAYLVSVRR